MSHRGIILFKLIDLAEKHFTLAVVTAGDTTMIRKLIIAAGVLIVIGLGVNFYLIGNLDKIIKEQVEIHGSEVAGVPVTVGSVSISLSDGIATIKQLRVSNPEGYSDRPAMSFNEVTAEIDIRTGTVIRVFSDTPTISIEGSSQQTNLDVLSDNISKATENHSNNNDKDDGDSIITINTIEIENATATLDFKGFSNPVSLTMDKIEFHQLTGTGSEISKQIMSQLTTKIKSAIEQRVGDLAKDAVKSEVERQVGKLQNKLKSLLN